ncbi:MAG: dipeptidase [Planctomycetaceae bacterium]
MLAFTDAHLDIAWSSLKHGRDFVAGHPDAALGLPDLLAGGVTLACATIFAADHGEEETPAEVADQQLAYYDALPGRSGGRVVWPADAMDVGTCRTGERLCLIGLMEGCEAVAQVEDLDAFYARGVRVVGLTWNHRNKWAGGTKAELGLTSDGVELVRRIDRLKMVHDLSHLSRVAVDDLLATARGPVIASHVACDALHSHPRNLTDAHMAEVAKRNGVVAIVFYSGFLGEGRPTLDDLVRHLLHALEVCGPDSVGIGTDFDGGFGRDELPAGIRTAADLPRVAAALRSQSIPENVVAKICGGNLRRLLTSVM